MAELYCDICGGGPVRAQILLEGAKVLACGRCMRSGKVLYRFTEERKGEPLVPQQKPSKMEGSEDIIENWGKALRAGRDKLGLPLSVVAERINEKESYLHAIETNRIMPTLDVARKLEKELTIKLIEKSEATVAPSMPASKSFSAPTLADMIDTKKKRA